MAEKKTVGYFGKVVGANVEKLKEDLGISWAELSRRLEENGRNIPELGLRNIAKGVRKVDIDDLISLAYALQSTPAFLITPPETPSTQSVPIAGHDVDLRDFWSWITNNYGAFKKFPEDQPISGAQEIFDHLARTRPIWELGRFLSLPNGSAGNDGEH